MLPCREIPSRILAGRVNGEAVITIWVPWLPRQTGFMLARGYGVQPSLDHHMSAPYSAIGLGISHWACMVDVGYLNDVVDSMRYNAISLVDIADN